MVKKLIRFIPYITGLAIALYAAFFFNIGFVPTEGNDFNIKGIANDTLFDESYYFPYSDSVPHYLYKKAEDSINQIQKQKERYSNTIAVDGFTFSSIGVKKLDNDWYSYTNQISQQMDSTELALQAQYDSVATLLILAKSKRDGVEISLLSDSIAAINKAINKQHIKLYNQQNGKKTEQYFLALSGYTLAPISRFMVKNERYYIKYVVWQQGKNFENRQSNNGHYEIKEIKTRFSSPDKTVLIPISKVKYKVIYFTLQILGFLFFLFAIQVFLIMPVKIGLNISKGKAFIPANIKMLRLIAAAFAIAYLFGFLIVYAPRFIYRDVIPPDFIPESFLSAFVNNLYYLFIAIAIWLLAKAFEKGYNLQQEQSLTI
jgi:hypothetical protein